MTMGLPTDNDTAIDITGHFSIPSFGFRLPVPCFISCRYRYLPNTYFIPISNISIRAIMGVWS